MNFMELGKTPISGGPPAGQDVRSDPDFEILTIEIDKLSSPTFSGTIDWGRMVVVATGILERKSKDLLVMAYLCVALLQTEGLVGLSKGLHILREGVESYWDDMFPAKKRMRGRKNAIEWLIDHLRDHLPSQQQEQWTADARNGFLEDLNALDRFLAENMEDAPILIPVIHEIATRLVTEETGAASPEKGPTTTGTTQPPPGQAAAIPEFDIADTDAEKMLAHALEILGRIATHLGSLDPPKPLAFRLNRIAAWTPVTELPPTSGSKTYIPGPDSQVVGILQNLYQSRNWKDLLQAAESRVRQFLFWFDLSRYVAESLEQLGCPEGADTVAAETLGYIKRFPGIENLAFEDGTAFASEQTRAWIKSGQEKQAAAGAGNAVPEGGGIHQAVEEALAEARKWIRNGKTKEALRYFNDGLSRPSSMKERFLWQQGLCRLLFEIRQPRLALPRIEDLLTAIDTYKIEEWEPDLALEAFTVILSGLRLQPEKDQDRLANVLNRLARLDPVRALDFI